MSKLGHIRIMAKLCEKRCPLNIKFRILSPETFYEAIDLMRSHFFPREPVSICLKALHDKIGLDFDQNIGSEEDRLDWLADTMRYCPTTIIAQDSDNNDKVVGIVVAGVAKRYTMEGSIEEWYDMKISNNELLKRWSAKSIELTGKGHVYPINITICIYKTQLILFNINNVIFH